MMIRVPDARLSTPILAVLAALILLLQTTEAAAQNAFMPVHLDPTTGKVLLEIPALDQDVLYMNALATGLGSARVFSLDTGSGVDEAVVQFQRHGPRVMMIRQNVTMTSQSGDPGQQWGVDRAFPVSVLASMEVADESGGRLLVDATDFLLSDAVDVRGSVRSAGLGQVQLERDRGYVDASLTSAYAKNTEIRTVLTFSADQLHSELARHTPDGRFITFEQHHSFMELPDPPMPGRVFDPRTGNGSVVLHDYSQNFDGDYRVRLTSRWRLEPTDTAAYLRGELVEPIQPIVLHLDPATPEPYRTAYRIGTLWWNEIFQAAGWRNGVQVRDLPQGADPMDTRYSVIQLINRSVPGPSTGGGRRDPRTGELLVGMPRMDSHRSMTDFNIYQGLLPVYEATGIQPQLTAEEFTMARRRQLAAHEVGHTLGFPHNFIAHTQGRSTTLDYPFPLIEVDEQGRLDISDAYREGGGWSDTLSVRYAYTWYPTPEAEAAGLANIVQEALDRGHFSSSDGSISDSYPEVSRWITGDDMFHTLDRSLRVRRQLLQHFDERAIRPGEPLSWLNQRFAHVYLHHRYAMEGMVRYVGGMQYRYALRGDGQTPTQAISGAQQRRALGEIVQVLSPEELAVPEHIPPLIPPSPPGYNEPAGWVNPAGVALPPAVGSHANWIESPAGAAFDPFAVARSFSQEVVDNLFNRVRMARVVALHGQDSSLPSLDEVLGTLVEGTWEAPGSRGGATGAYRRAAERSVLDGLFTLASDSQAVDAVRDGAALRLELLAEYLQAQGAAARSGGADDQAHTGRALREIRSYLTTGEVPALRSGVIQIPLPWP
ncbi:MAG: zinc-dependent metalloprotease [Gemmatimonadota bacterium]